MKDPWNNILLPDWQQAVANGTTTRGLEDWINEEVDLGEMELRQCDGCGKIEDAGTYPDQDGEGRSECCWPAHQYEAWVLAQMREEREA